MQIPSAWLKQDKFLKYLPYFSHRFVIYGHDEKNESWEICRQDACEASGEGFDLFRQILKSPQEETK